MPWGVILLALCLLSMVVGLVTAGLPSLLVAVSALSFKLAGGKRLSVWMLLLILLLSAVGIAAGLASSWFIYLK